MGWRQLFRSAFGLTCAPQPQEETTEDSTASWVELQSKIDMDFLAYARREREAKRQAKLDAIQRNEDAFARASVESGVPKIICTL